MSLQSKNSFGSHIAQVTNVSFKIYMIGLDMTDHRELSHFSKTTLQTPPRSTYISYHPLKHLSLYQLHF